MAQNKYQVEILQFLRSQVTTTFQNWQFIFTLFKIISIHPESVSLISSDLRILIDASLNIFSRVKKGKNYDLGFSRP